MTPETLISVILTVAIISIVTAIIFLILAAKSKEYITFHRLSDAGFFFVMVAVFAFCFWYIGPEPIKSINQTIGEIGVRALEDGRK